MKTTFASPSRPGVIGALVLTLNLLGAALVLAAEPPADNPPVTTSPTIDYAALADSTVGLAERLLRQTEILRELALTNDQKADLADLRAREEAEVRAIDNRWLLTRTQKERRIREAREKFAVKARAALSEDQVRKLDLLTARDLTHSELRENPARLRDQIHPAPKPEEPQPHR